MIKLHGRPVPAWPLLVLAALAVRLALSPLPGYDVRDYRLWAGLVAAGGVTSTYHADIFIPYNYPPVFLYVLDAIVRIYRLLSPSFDAASPILGVLLKAPAILADSAAALVIYLFLRRRTSPNLALLGGMAYALNPAAIWNTAYWGGIDAIHSLLAFLAIVILLKGLPEVSWLLLALSLLTKPLSVPILIVAAFLTFHRFGPRRMALCGAVASATAAAVAAPFLAAGTLSEMGNALMDNLGNYDNVSANAHNLWWLVSGGNGWTKDTTLFLGTANYRTIGFVLFGLFVFACLRSLQNKGTAGYASSGDTAGRDACSSGPAHQEEARFFFICSLLGFAFYMLPTEVHENWMFGVFPFLTVASALDPRLRPFLVALTVTFLLNMALHDLAFGYRLPQGPLGSFLASARMANAVANNIILAYAALFLLGTHRLSALAGRLSLIRRRGLDAPG